MKGRCYRGWGQRIKRQRRKNMELGCLIGDQRWPPLFQETHKRYLVHQTLLPYLSGFNKSWDECFPLFPSLIKFGKNLGYGIWVPPPIRWGFPLSSNNMSYVTHLCLVTPIFLLFLFFLVKEQILIITHRNKLFFIIFNFSLQLSLLSHDCGTIWDLITFRMCPCGVGKLFAYSIINLNFSFLFFLVKFSSSIRLNSNLNKMSKILWKGYFII